MYKKITHTITEEHFSHPKGAQIKNSLRYVGDDDMPLMLGLTTAGKFKSDVAEYFSTLHSRLDSIATATANGNMDTLLTEETAFFDEVENLGKILLPYYGLEFSERLNQVFRAVGLSSLGIYRNLKYKNDIKFATDRLDQNFNQLGILLNQYNNQWAIYAVESTWLAIREALVTEATAIMNKDTTGSVSTDRQVADRLTAFANDLADSVIKQYPNKFIL